MKKIKFFGISATILLMLVAIGPGIASAEQPMDYYRGLADKYRVELTALEDYITDYLSSFGSLDGIAYSREQIAFMNKFAAETLSIYQRYGIPEYPQYPPGETTGITALYFSNTQIHIKYHSEFSPVYWAIQPCIGHYLTCFWADLIYVVGAFTALMIMGAILLAYFGIDDLDEFLYWMGFLIIHAVIFYEFLQVYLDTHYGQGIYILKWRGSYHLPIFGPQPQLDGCAHYKWIKINNEYKPNPAYWHTLL